MITAILRWRDSMKSVQKTSTSVNITGTALVVLMTLVYAVILTVAVNAFFDPDISVYEGYCILITWLGAIVTFKVVWKS